MDDPLFRLIQAEKTAYNLELEALFPGEGRRGLAALGQRAHPFFSVKRDRLPADGELTLGQCAKISKNLVLQESRQPQAVRALYDDCHRIAKTVCATERGVFGDRSMKAMEEFLAARIQRMSAAERDALLPDLRRLLEVDLRIVKLREVFCLGNRPQFKPMDVVMVPHLLSLLDAEAAKPAQRPLAS